MTKKRIGIYPGTFDPITLGHVDIIKRAVQLVDVLIIAVARDNNKNPIFSLEQRKELVQNDVQNLLQLDEGCVVVKSFEGLLVDFARKENANVIVRGLRAVSDFEYEFQMFGMNSRLDPSIQTIFLPAAESHHFVASRFVKEVARLGGDVSSFVSGNVKVELEKIPNIT